MDLADFDWKFSNGRVLGFETDTVWGLGCLPNDKAAVDKIYEIKGRDRSKPLILMSDSVKHLLPYVKSVPEYAKSLMDNYFPGALTLIFDKTDLVPDFITSGKNTVGIRVPAHAGFKNLCCKIQGRVLATTSLNRSNELPVADYEKALREFDGLVNVIKPEIPCSAGVSSTVVLCTGNEPVVLRQGSVEI